METGLYYNVNENYHKAQDFCDIAHNNIVNKYRDFPFIKTDIHMLESLQLLCEMSEFLQIGILFPIFVIRNNNGNISSHK